MTKDELRAELERQKQRYETVYGGEVVTYAAQPDPDRKPWLKRLSLLDEAPGRGQKGRAPAGNIASGLIMRDTARQQLTLVTGVARPSGLRGKSRPSAGFFRLWIQANRLDMKSHKNDIRYQAYRSQARNLAAELLSGQPDLLREGIDPLQVRFEPITDEAIEACHLWGEEAELFGWNDAIKT